VHLLVVGGSGFLGLGITRQARLAGHRVTATCQASAPPGYDESSPPDPVTPYGAAKAAAETAVTVSRAGG
jgi:dTDP-4-dehydrorhamnose reductase